MKLAYSEARQRFGELCLQVLDRDALHVDGNELVEERLRTLALTIAAGTSQIQRNIIGERVLGLPEGAALDGPRPLRRPGRAARRHRGAARRPRSRSTACAPASTARCSTSSPRPACSRCAPTGSRGPTASSCSSSSAGTACPARSSPSLLLGDGRIAGVVERRRSRCGSSTSTRSTCCRARRHGRRPRRRPARARRASRRPGRSIRCTPVAARRAAARPARRSTSTRPTASSRRARCSPPRSSSAWPTGCTELAVAYAKERVQFDRPIGSFQAIKHLLADMLVRTEVARAAVYARGARARRGRRARRRSHRARARRQGAGRRSRDRERQGRDAGVRRHGLHVGGRRAPLPEAGVGARHALRERPTTTPSSCARPRATRGSRRFLTLLSCPWRRGRRPLFSRRSPSASPPIPTVPTSTSPTAGGDACSYTAREMDAESNRLAHTLRELGVGHGDRVATLLENRAEQVVSFFAALKLGAVQVPINTAYKGEFLRHQLADSGAKVFIVQGDFASRAVEVVGAETTPDADALHHRRSARRGDRRRARRSRGRTRSRPGATTADRRRRRCGPATSRASSTPRARPARRKGCMLPHNYIVSLAEQIARAWQRTRRRRRAHAAAALPLQRDLGVRGRHAARRRPRRDRAQVLGEQLLARGQAHRRDDGVDARLARDPHRQRRGPPRPGRPQAAAVRGGADAARHRPAVAASGSGARRSAAATASPRRRSSRCSTRASRTSRARRASRTCTSSTCASSTTTTCEVAAGEVGEIVCRPERPEPDVRRATGTGPTRPSRRLRNLWFHTGDLGRIDDDGFLYFVDRKKDALRRRGENISSFEMEKTLFGARGDPGRRGARGAERRSARTT